MLIKLIQYWLVASWCYKKTLVYNTLNRNFRTFRLAEPQEMRQTSIWTDPTVPRLLAPAVTSSYFLPYRSLIKHFMFVCQILNQKMPPSPILNVALFFKKIIFKSPNKNWHTDKRQLLMARLAMNFYGHLVGVRGKKSFQPGADWVPLSASSYTIIIQRNHNCLNFCRGQKIVRQHKEARTF